MTTLSFILGRELILALIEAEIVPEGCTSAIIEAHVDKAVQLHYTVIGDDRLVKVLPSEAKAAGVREYIKNDKGEDVEVTTP